MRERIWQHDELEKEATKHRAEKKKTNALTDSNYFYTAESIPCTNFPVRVMQFACTHFGISNLSGKNVKIDNNTLTAIQERFLCYSYSPSFEVFSILTAESNDFKLKIMKSLLAY